MPKAARVIGGLQLDVSQARVVQDERWKALVAQLAEIRDELIARLEQPLHAQGRPSPAALAPLRRIAITAAQAVTIADPHDTDHAAPTENVDSSLAAPTSAHIVEALAEDRRAEVAIGEAPSTHAQPAESATQPGAEANPTAARAVHRPDPTIAASPLEALRIEVEAMLTVAVDRPTLERACETLLRDLPWLGVAFLRDPSGSARVVLAWQIADRLHLAGGKPSLAVEMAPRVAHALAELAARPRPAAV